MRVFVTGATGQLGYDVCRELSRRNAEYMGTGSRELDITDADAVREALTAYHPDAVIHCAAWTAVDAAEDEPERCFAVNRDGTANIAAVCAGIGAKMLYLSTDYVFPGTGESYYRPEDPTGPVNVYGRSKLAGEEAVRHALDRFFIVRISWVFGINGKNFIRTMLRLSGERREVGVVYDQIGSPTYTADLAPLLCDMIAGEKYGVYHATNEGICSWADLAEKTFRLAGKNVKVNRLTTAEYGARAPRPLNSRLDKSGLTRAGFTRLPDWRDALARYLGEIT